MTGFVIALLLPWLLGASWLSLLWRSANLPTVLGFGYILGIGMVSGLLKLWADAGLPLAFWWIAVLLFFFCLLPLVLVLRRRRDKTAGITTTQPRGYGYGDAGDEGAHIKARWRLFFRLVQGAVFILLAFVLLVRFSTLFLDTVARPLFAWDAWMNFAPKAKVWFELLSLQPFISPELWLESGESGEYTLGNPQAWSYPSTIPLIMLWHALGLDEWRDDLIKIPWVLCAIALALAVYGQLRQTGVARHWAMLCVYLLCSLPYLNVHIVLGGYADLWLATTVCMAFLAFLNWREQRQWQALLILLCLVILGSTIKHPGYLWGGVLILVLLMDRLGKWGIAFFLAAGAGLLIVLFSGGIDVQIPGVGRIALSPQEVVIPFRGTYDIEFYNISDVLISSLFVQPNWHMLWYAIAIILPFGIIAGRFHFYHLGPLLFLLMSLAALFLIFSFIPRYSAEARNMVTLNRTLLHLTPAIMVFFFWWCLAPQTEEKT